MTNLSLILPAYNEEDIIKGNVEKLHKYVSKLKSTNKFEIIICPNGCTDNTEKYSFELAERYGNIKVFPNQRKGIGIGIREGIKHAKYEYAMFYSVDLPFGFDIVKDSIHEKGKADIIIGSKAHKNSAGGRNLNRSLISKIYNRLLKILFGINVGDTQGTLFFPTKEIKSYLNKLDSENSFFETQLVIYGIRNNLKIKEIPVKFEKTRKSKIPIISESYNVLKDLAKELLIK